MFNILLSRSLLTTLWVAPLKLSDRWGYWIENKRKGKRDGGKVDYSHQQQRARLPKRFNEHTGITQNNEIFIKIAWSYKSCYIKNRKEKKKGRILQGIRLCYCINIYHTGQLFILSRLIKPVRNFLLLTFEYNITRPFRNSKTLHFSIEWLHRACLKNSKG